MSGRMTGAEEVFECLVEAEQGIPESELVRLGEPQGLRILLEQREFLAVGIGV